MAFDKSKGHPGAISATRVRHPYGGHSSVPIFLESFEVVLFWNFHFGRAAVPASMR